MDLLAYMLASGGDDNSLKLWFWLIVGVIFLGLCSRRRRDPLRFAGHGGGGKLYRRG
jgi:hypothetical protein